MRFLFVMDPATTMLPDKDTSFAFMRAAQDLGHTVYHCQPRDLFQRGADVFAMACVTQVSAAPPHVTQTAPELVEVAEMDAVLIRKDPPFDVAYAHLTQQLDLVKHRTLVVNDPAALRSANEKLYAFHFVEHMPPSMVSANPEQIRSFVVEVGGRAVLKPLDGAGGSGVVALATDDPNTRALIDLLTREGRELALVQKYLPAIRTGDKRVLLLDGEPLGAILRVPRPDDIRANIHVGGQVQPTELTPSEQALVADMGPKLKAAGLWFVGLDLIGGHLIEVNVTSPTGIQELGRFTGSRPEEAVIRWVATRAGELRTPALGA
ncbi:MAG TPA: glutathione synthase [Polyangiaceae bacterium]